MRIELPSGTPAFLATPSDGTTSVRGVVLIPDIGGLRPLFDDLCQRLADDHGWAVCAVEPWPGRESMPLAEKLEAVGSIRDADILGDLSAAADATGVEPVAVIGFCLGGMYTMKAAGTGRFDRACPFYGMIRLPENWHGEDQSEPLDGVTSEGAAPVLGFFGTADRWTPSDELDALEAVGAEVIRYAGADHGFVHDPSRDAHRADYAADAWRRVAEFLVV